MFRNFFHIIINNISYSCKMIILSFSSLEDNVIVYSNATVLGRITIATGTVIGGNLWVTESTKPGEQLVQARKRKTHIVRPEDWGGL